LFSQSAHARGDGGGFLLIVLLVLFAPLLIWLMQIWMGLLFTVAPIVIGIYIWITGKGVTAFFIGTILIGLGVFMTLATAPPEVLTRIKKFLE